MDLFEYHPPYPQSAGWKDGDTSHKAAKSMTSATGRLRRKVLAALVGKPMTADETALDIGETILSIRPRLTELQALGMICDTGMRRPNASGRMAKVFTLTGE